MSDSLHRILIADEDPEMRELISQPLYEYETALVIEQAAQGGEVLKLVASQDYALAIVNWTLPEVSKAELFSQIRQLKPASSLPILVMVSSLMDADGVAEVLQSGANEVLSKPFERSQLLSKIKLFLKKELPQSSDRLAIGELSLDTRTYDVYCGGERVHLTPSEFKLLQALVEHQGEVLTREQLIERVQGEGIAVIDRAVDTHIFSLRRKLGAFADRVETVRGLGYRIN